MNQALYVKSVIILNLYLVLATDIILFNFIIEQHLTTLG